MKGINNEGKSFYFKKSKTKMPGISNKILNTKGFKIINGDE
jgi:hypothetical protein